MQLGFRDPVAEEEARIEEEAARVIEQINEHRERLKIKN